MTTPSNTSALPRQNTHKNYITDSQLLKVTSGLKGVIKRHNGGMLAFCPSPSHNDRKGRSLAVSIGRQGQVLMHCFAGCSIHEITAALGLDMADLFVKSDQQTYDKQSRSYFNEWQILQSLRFDAMVILIAANRLLAGDALPDADVTYLSEAIVRIHEAITYSARGDR